MKIENQMLFSLPLYELKTFSVPELSYFGPRCIVGTSCCCRCCCCATACVTPHTTACVHRTIYQYLGKMPSCSMLTSQPAIRRGRSRRKICDRTHARYFVGECISSPGTCRSLLTRRNRCFPSGKAGRQKDGLVGSDRVESCGLVRDSGLFPPMNGTRRDYRK